ncbi:5-demethoxyubiquinol-8 5-hydroxylase UbiM, partial [Xanthomonas campestris]
LAARPLYEATNALAALYTDGRAPARLLRRGALRAANAVAPFKQAIAAHLTQRSV